MQSSELDDNIIAKVNSETLDKWYTPKVGRKVKVILRSSKNKVVAGVIKKVHPFENTFNVQLKHSYQGKNDKEGIKVLENVNRQDIISSSWARKSGNVPPSFLSCMSGGGAGGADRPVRTVRDVPFVAALARSAKEQGVNVSDIDLQGIFQAFNYKNDFFQGKYYSTKGVLGKVFS